MPPIGLSPPKTSGNLKDVSPVPAATKAIKIERKQIPVLKKSGG